jgi:hypothetical protein
MVSEAGQSFSTWMGSLAICTSPNDDHPFDNGYAAIADVVYAASGYGSRR